METEAGIELEAPKRRNKGFTLIELIIVIVILGILTTVVVLAVGGLRDEAQDGHLRDRPRGDGDRAVEAYVTARSGNDATSPADRGRRGDDSGHLKDVSS